MAIIIWLLCYIHVVKEATIPGAKSITVYNRICTQQTSQGSHQAIFEGYRTFLEKKKYPVICTLLNYSVVYSILIVGGRRLQVGLHTIQI